MTGGAGQKSAPCGARTGCFLCTAVGRDASMENMLEQDSRYHYMRGLNRLQRFLLATQYDLSRRNWFGRKIEKEWIQVAPQTYSKEMLLDLLRYCLTLDRDELVASQRAGLAAPRFQMISTEALIAIDATWSLHGVLWRPFAALEAYRDVYINGMSYEIPEIEPFPVVPIPKPRFLKVGSDKDGPHRYGGLYDPVLDALGGDGCMGSRTLRNGETILDVETGPEFSVDLEGALFILDYDLDHLIEMGRRYESWSAQAFRHYVSMGTINLSQSQLTRTHNILKRTQFKEDAGLNALEDPSLIYPYCEEMPAELVKAGKDGQPVEHQMEMNLETTFWKEAA